MLLEVNLFSVAIVCSCCCCLNWISSCKKGFIDVYGKPFLQVRTSFYLKWSHLLNIVAQDCSFATGQLYQLAGQFSRKQILSLSNRLLLLPANFSFFAYIVPIELVHRKYSPFWRHLLHSVFQWLSMKC